MNNLSQIEALLFISGDEGISITNISGITGFDRSAIQGLIEELTLKYDNDDNSALEIRANNDVYRLVTKSKLGGTVKKYFESPVDTTLSQVQLETLVIVAYKQPLTRIEVDQIRGVQSAGALQKLMIRQLIYEVGRKEEPGRPIMYGTTDIFLDYFGLKNIQELPPLPDFSMLDISDDFDGDLFTSAFDAQELESEEKNV
ncbi:segregation and condensation protein B [Leuconostoc litchii]|uniref:Segregation and condensation protein B n=1 Tax=Leuconostoc litchii TaxID=1981069 RepID=A0A6P2CL56_9LACO|nr:SMC-Scp complex subunit ScpB [Leuconostoc litchii]TYC46788.1 SMC-Scp complex subunit ScpB [Leuconostoc litchii]GMA70676.1 segregation and condensation protein B [Leuconostoc litchii]